MTFVIQITLLSQYSFRLAALGNQSIFPPVTIIPLQPDLSCKKTNNLTNLTRAGEWETLGETLFRKKEFPPDPLQKNRKKILHSVAAALFDAAERRPHKGKGKSGRKTTRFPFGIEMFWSTKLAGRFPAHPDGKREIEGKFSRMATEFPFGIGMFWSAKLVGRFPAHPGEKREIEGKFSRMATEFPFGIGMFWSAKLVGRFPAHPGGKREIEGKFSRMATEFPFWIGMFWSTKLAGRFQLIPTENAKSRRRSPRFRP